MPEKEIVNARQILSINVIINIEIFLSISLIYIKIVELRVNVYLQIERIYMLVHREDMAAK